MKHSYERWLLSLDVRCDDAVPPAIVVRRVLKWLLRSWGLKCTGLSVDEELMKLRAENAELRRLVTGLADRVAGQSELLSQRAERRP